MISQSVRFPSLLQPSRIPLCDYVLFKANDSFTQIALEIFSLSFVSIFPYSVCVLDGIMCYPEFPSRTETLFLQASKSVNNK